MRVLPKFSFLVILSLTLVSNLLKSQVIVQIVDEQGKPYDGAAMAIFTKTKSKVYFSDPQGYTHIETELFNSIDSISVRHFEGFDTTYFTTNNLLVARRKVLQLHQLTIQPRKTRIIGNQAKSTTSGRSSYFGCSSLIFSRESDFSGFRRLKSIRINLDIDPSGKGEPKPFYIQVFTTDASGKILADIFGDSILVKSKWSWINNYRWVEVDLQNKEIIIPDGGGVAFGIKVPSWDYLKANKYTQHKTYSEYQLYNTLSVATNRGKFPVGTTFRSFTYCPWDNAYEFLPDKNFMIQLEIE
ncbi:MAG: hypothetical protein V4616_10150 [Bacteroidota bacterium]